MPPLSDRVQLEIMEPTSLPSTYIAVAVVFGAFIAVSLASVSLICGCCSSGDEQDGNVQADGDKQQQKGKPKKKTKRSGKKLGKQASRKRVTFAKSVIVFRDVQTPRQDKEGPKETAKAASPTATDSKKLKSKMTCSDQAPLPSIFRATGLSPPPDYAVPSAAYPKSPTCVIKRGDQMSKKPEEATKATEKMQPPIDGKTVPLKTQKSAVGKPATELAPKMQTTQLMVQTARIAEMPTMNLQSTAKATTPTPPPMPPPPPTPKKKSPAALVKSTAASLVKVVAAPPVEVPKAVSVKKAAFTNRPKRTTAAKTARDNAPTTKAKKETSMIRPTSKSENPISKEISPFSHMHVASYEVQTPRLR